MLKKLFYALCAFFLAFVDKIDYRLEPRLVFLRRIIMRHLIVWRSWAPKHSAFKGRYYSHTKGEEALLEQMRSARLAREKR